MGALSIKIGILTSSRADFGIYLPLLRAMQKDSLFEMKLIVFGTHLSEQHGYTLSEIESQGFQGDYLVNTYLPGDTPADIARSMAHTMTEFVKFWKSNHNWFDLVFCLGDRYEMFAAVSAGATFRIKFAHIHGGEKTLGAIDNFFRHSISHQAWCHFTSTEEYTQRLYSLLDLPERIFTVGSLSIDSLESMQLLSRSELQMKYGVDFKKPIVIVTFHPETVKYEYNLNYAREICELLVKRNDLEFILTLPNVDTSGASVRSILIDKLSHLSHVKIFENLGTLAYFSFMKEGNLIFGNSSSGIIEAASFNKYVINLGERQLGRMQSSNVINVPIQLEEMNDALNKSLKLGIYKGSNVYYQGGSVLRIISTVKQIVKMHEN